MNAAALLIVCIVAFVFSYTLYGRWLARKWGIDPTRRTPAVEINDGVDYVPSKRFVLFGHHFSSIAGAGPINGPIQACVFGWLPVSLWIIIGTTFFGGPHDTGSLLYSVRNKGKSFFAKVDLYLGPNSKKLLVAFFYFNAVLLIASFLSIVADTFTSSSTEGLSASDGPRVAMISMLFIPAALILGIYINRYRPSMPSMVLVGLSLLIVALVVGYNFPVDLPYTAWVIIIMGYIIVASVIPVWLLLQPRDFLSSFLLYGTVGLAVIGILFSGTEMRLPAFTSFETELGWLFPVLFVTVACGAISGFHTIVSTGTTSKQIASEADIIPIGYGGMVMEGILAIIAVIAAATLFANISGTSMTPLQVFAEGISTMFDKLGFGEHHSFIYCILMLALSAFILTSLDTSTRIGRYMVQEIMSERNTPISKVLGRPFAATLITVFLAAFISYVGYQSLWTLFGTLNQLMAGFSLMLVASWLYHKGKDYRMLIIPAVLMFLTTITMLVYYVCSKTMIVLNGFDAVELFLLAFSLVLLIGTVYVLYNDYRFFKRKDLSDFDDDA